MEITMITLDDLQPHPLNAEIFTTNERDEHELKTQVEMHGVVVPILVNRRADGTLRIISGHRRVDVAKSLEIGQVKGEIIAVGDAEELLLLFACNVGRDMKEAYKVRFFKAVKQFLRQFRKNVGKQSTSDDDAPTNNPFVDTVARMGVDVNSMKMWEVIRHVTGFSEREQYTLTRICDVEYRKKFLDDLRSLGKIKEPAIMGLEVSWQAMEESIVSGTSTIADAEKQIKQLMKQVDLLKNPPAVVKKPKPVKVIKEVAVEKNASVYVNTVECAKVWARERLGYGSEKGAPSYETMVTVAVEWAQLVLDNQ